jgi:hypothetical protein
MARGGSDVGYQRLKTDRATFAILVVLALAGVGLLIAGEKTSDAHHPIWRAVLLSLGGLLVASATLTLLWELRGRRTFAQEVLAAAGVAADTRKAGLRAIAGDYLHVTDWPELFRNAHEIDVFASWGATWRRTYEREWNAWIERRNVRLRVLLPNSADDTLVTHLARRFDKTEDYVRERINETRRYYDEELRARAGEGTEIAVRHLSRAPVWSYYGMGQTVVAVLYAQSLTSAPEVPAMVFTKGGDTGRFFAGQFDACWNEAG